MAIWKPRTIIAAAGAIMLLSGFVGGWFSFDAALRHANVGSYPNAVWARWEARNPMWDWDRFWIGFPVRYLIFSGLVLLAVSFIWMIAATPKYVSPRSPPRSIEE
jgi:hypothetical protein